MGDREGRFGEVFDAVLMGAQAGAPWAFDRPYRALALSVTGYVRLQVARPK